MTAPKSVTNGVFTKKSQSPFCDLHMFLDVLSPVDCGCLATRGYFVIWAAMKIYLLYVGFEFLKPCS